jgi:hypothetical protein
MPKGLPVGVRLGCRRHVLVMNPDPREIIQKNHFFTTLFQLTGKFADALY